MMKIAGLLLILLASVNAHMWLRTPLSRGGLNSIGGTTGPCDGLNTGGTVNTYEVGQSVNFQFRVNQNGPDPFNFKLLDSNNAVITLTQTEGTLPTNLQNSVTAGPDGFQGVNAAATIPNYVCSNCAVQLSGMGNNGANTWYQCASVVIVPAGTLNSPQPNAVNPNNALTTGGGTCAVYGIGFGNTTQSIYCSFGGNIVMGTWVNSSMVTCPIPPNNNPSTSTIEVSTNGIAFSSTGTIFTYTGNTILPVITSISPNPASPGQNVTITGSNFYSKNMLCKFNGTVSVATVTSISQAVCSVPTSLGNAQISVTVTVDNSPPSAPFSFKVSGSNAPMALLLPPQVIAGVVVGVFFFGTLIGVFTFLVVTKRVSFGSVSTPSGWQRSV